MRAAPCLLQGSIAFIDHRIEAALDDFLVGYLAFLHVRTAAEILDDGKRLGAGRAIALFVIVVKALAVFCPKRPARHMASRTLVGSSEVSRCQPISIPARSAIWKGPIRKPKSVNTLSICSGDAPSIKSAFAGIWRWLSMRLPIKPWQTPAPPQSCRFSCR